MHFIYRIKREVNTSMIERGVKERLNLRKLYEKKREELISQYDELREQLEEEKMKVDFPVFILVLQTY